MVHINKFYLYSGWIGLIALIVIASALRLAVTDDWIKIANIVLPSLAILVAIQHFKIQHQMNFFSEYTKRYQELILKFPNNINSTDFTLEGLDDTERDSLLRVMQAYFDLCCEEYTLYKNHKIDKQTWLEWDEGIGSAFKKTAFQQSWEKITNESVYFHKEFKNYIHTKINIENDHQNFNHAFKTYNIIVLCFFLLSFGWWTRDVSELFSGGAFIFHVSIYLSFAIGLITILYGYKKKLYKIKFPHPKL